MHDDENILTQNPDKFSFELLSAKKTADGKLVNSFPMGKATSFPGTNFYVVKIWSLYQNTYFLVKNFADPSRYTLFAKKEEGENGVKFLNPIGTGRINADLKTHLEIRVRFPFQSIFMNLYPNPQH